VHVHYLAPLKVLVIEVADYELGLGHMRKKLIFLNFSVLPVSLSDVSLFLGVVGLHLLEALVPDPPHYLLLLLVPVLFILVVLIIVLVMVDVVRELAWVDQSSAFLVLQLLLHLNRLVFNCLFHNHV
jgi:hypothetical protein